ncbi:exo 1,3/1,4-beta-D-glucan glucohydrolase [Rheinheimera sp. YQF-2]|uniref:Exo 1,3/1,4-beta-D-glucan glucohydrolase n=1 Tax=Rheinheimera lutimaris TaxID=2740584 RepID=A0A7Y5APB5_9GAMM|nr:exo 1,3/1,4-beta-D-glucan glucohydrolase [Rheinheimera lutimaris]NRQ41749.1 exo 1,3/1,4-beta-D-glucan glucohydrolase [Rheinheimera lutimaris]
MYHLTKQALLLSTIALAVAGCNNDPAATNTASSAKAELQHNIEYWPAVSSPVKKDPTLELQIQQILAAMTPEQKVAQLIQPDIRWVSLEDMRQYGFGSVLNGGGAYPNDNKKSTAADWSALADAYYHASVDDSIDGSAIPSMWGTDAVHGHNNLYGATVFPHNIGLGASNNPQLVEDIGKVTAETVMATGINWIFAPTVAVARDDRWGRTYEAYAEDPAIVKSLGAALVRGIQGAPGAEFMQRGRVIATAKHYLGDGGTLSGKDQGNNLDNEADLVRVHAQGYITAIEAGVQTIMASFNTWHGEKMHGNHYLLTEVLKQRMGFDGVVVGDWNGHGQIPGCSNTDCAAAVNAGVDILMVPEDWKALYYNTLEQAKSGVIPSDRLNDAVTRILRVKLRAGLFERGAPSTHAPQQQITAVPAHQALAAQAVRESLVLLKNNNNILPLSAKQRILIAGDGADNMSKQTGGWTISWQGTGNLNADFPNGQTIYQGIADQVTVAGGVAELSVDGSYQQKPDVAIVVIGENPYAEFDGDVPTLDYQSGTDSDLQLLKKLKADGIKVVTVFLSGRPLWVNPELNQSDAFVAAWLPGTAGQAVADVLLRDGNDEVRYDFSGKLSFSWPKDANSQPLNVGDKAYDPLFAFGYGLTYADSVMLPNDLSEQTDIVVVTEAGTLNLFERRPAEGFSLQLKDASGAALVSGNKSQSPDGSLTFAAVNWQKQEDAILLNWQTSSSATLGLHTDKPLDASGYNQLVLDMKWSAAPEAPVMLGMSCGSGCGAEVDLSGLLKDKALNQWRLVSIDLSCFAGKGAALNHLQQPFLISSKAPFQLTLANIRLTSGNIRSDIGCAQ